MERANASRRLVLTKEVSALEIESDPLHIRYVVVNLLENGLKYSEGQVRISVGGDGPEARVIVTDNGIGVPPDDLEALFSPFFRASNVAGRPGGGMGLAIVKKSANLLGARIAVDSADGEGTTFTISFPRSLPR